jgi:hypothetical protein
MHAQSSSTSADGPCWRLFFSDSPPSPLRPPPPPPRRPRAALTALASALASAAASVAAAASAAAAASPGLACSPRTSRVARCLLEPTLPCTPLFSRPPPNTDGPSAPPAAAARPPSASSPSRRLSRWTLPLDSPAGLSRWTLPLDSPAGLPTPYLPLAHSALTRSWLLARALIAHRARHPVRNNAQRTAQPQLTSCHSRSHSSQARCRAGGVGVGRVV